MTHNNLCCRKRSPMAANRMAPPTHTTASTPTSRRPSSAPMRQHLETSNSHMCKNKRNANSYSSVPTTRHHFTTYCSDLHCVCCRDYLGIPRLMSKTPAIIALHSFSFAAALLALGITPTIRCSVADVTTLMTLNIRLPF